MDSKRNGPVVLITGASRGIGRATARAFAQRGWRTLLVGLAEKELNRVASEVRDMGTDAEAIVADLTAPGAAETISAKGLAVFGLIDALVNNAGIARVGPIQAEGFEQDIFDTMQASLFGMIRLTKAVLPNMLQRRSGTIVNMSSVMGRKAFANFGSYAVVMHAVTAFSDALRQEVKEAGVTVCTVHPALTATGLLSQADEAQMPPPFRYMTPISADRVGKAVVNATEAGKERVVIPGTPNILLLADAISPRMGDAVAQRLGNKRVARFLGIYRGKNYHGALADLQE